MESINLNQSISKNADFIQRIGEESGQPVQKCYQCGKCTAGVRWHLLWITLQTR